MTEEKLEEIVHTRVVEYTLKGFIVHGHNRLGEEMMEVEYELEEGKESLYLLKGCLLGPTLDEQGITLIRKGEKVDHILVIENFIKREGNEERFQKADKLFEKWYNLLKIEENYKEWQKLKEQGRISEPGKKVDEGEYLDSYLNTI